MIYDNLTNNLEMIYDDLTMEMISHIILPIKSLNLAHNSTNPIARMGETSTDVVHIIVFNSQINYRGDYFVYKNMIPTWLNDCAIDDFKIYQLFASKPFVTEEEHRQMVLRQTHEFIHGLVAFDQRGSIANGHVDVPDFSTEPKIQEFLFTLLSGRYQNPKLTNINMHYLVVSM